MAHDVASFARTKRLLRAAIGPCLAGRKAVLVGELNPYRSDPRLALWPDPPNASGGRLCRAMGLDPEEYLRMFTRMNLCSVAWSGKLARLAAERALQEHPDATFVLLGKKVSEAFLEEFRPFTLRGFRAGWAGFVTLPHPSGLNRMWNEDGAVERARAVLREAGVLQ